TASTTASAAGAEPAVCGAPIPGAPQSLDPARLGERQPGAAREQLRAIAVAEVADEVRPHRGPGPERGVDPRVVEPAHRPAVEADRARREDEVAALQAGVAKRRRLDVLRLADEPRLRVGVR